MQCTVRKCVSIFLALIYILKYIMNITCWFALLEQSISSFCWCWWWRISQAFWWLSLALTNKKAHRPIPITTEQLSDADILYVRSKFRRNVIKSVSGHSLTSSSHCNFYFSTGHIQISTHSFKGSLSLFSYAIALSICKTKPFFDRGRRRPPANPLQIYILSFSSFI